MINYTHNPSTVSNTTNAIGSYHLMNNPNLYEIQRRNNFEITIDLGNDIIQTAFGNAVQKAGTSGINDSSVYVVAPDEKLTISVTNCTVPHFSQDAIRVKRGNNEIRYAGVPKFDSGSITFNDYIGAEVVDILYAWQNKSYNVFTEKVGLVEDYKKTAILTEYTPDYQVVRVWKLYGVWVSSIKEDGFDYENGGKNTVSCTLEYDKAVIDYKAFLEATTTLV